MVKSDQFEMETEGFGDTLDITGEVARIVADSGLDAGIVTVFVPGSTAGITTLEYEPGAVEDLKQAVDRLAPAEMHYNHDARWGDGNGFSHVRSALMGASITVPFNAKKLALGTWQQIILCDFDNRSRKRRILVQMLGE
mgnify:FL=1|jgi:secondary thiamine-phosphate synthase enzyme